MDNLIKKGYDYAREAYGKWGVDTDAVITKLAEVTLSLHCWQGDDVTGFEEGGAAAGGGTLVTGAYPGKARNPQELRDDLELAMSLIPGEQKVSLHSNYAETGGKKVGRDELEPAHFANWASWAKEKKIGLDFNPTFFDHPMLKDGFSLSSADPAVRKYWIGHGIACRRIGDYFGKTLGADCVTNFWMPDGYKDVPVDRAAPRERMRESLDAIFREPFEHNIDAVESKLFGIGFESYTVVSNEFCLGYASAAGKLLTLDAGHFHPTEVISDKISAVMGFVPGILLHISRPVRWDSDHVVTFDDELRAIMQEIVRNGYADRVFLGLDYFDASINRIAAWAIGSRNAMRAMLYAMLEPVDILKKAELDGDLTARLALLEEFKTYPFGLVWDYFCLTEGVPVREGWLGAVREYEKRVLASRA